MNKNRVVEVVEALPEEVDLDALIERLYLLKRLELAEEEVTQGRVLEHDEIESRFASWLE